jgi:hypothetical protein
VGTAAPEEVGRVRAMPTITKIIVMKIRIARTY